METDLIKKFDMMLPKSAMCAPTRVIYVPDSQVKSQDFYKPRIYVNNWRRIKNNEAKKVF